MHASRRWLAVLAPVLAVIAAGCGSSASSSSSATKASSASAAAKPTTSASSSSSSGGTVSGKWSGQYSGAYSGSFNLNWRQAGSQLVGAIALHPGGNFAIHGTMTGGNIKFGTVGGPAITYTGSVSGSSMSGNYSTPNGGGSWSANKA